MIVSRAAARVAAIIFVSNGPAEQRDEDELDERRDEKEVDGTREDRRARGRRDEGEGTRKRSTGGDEAEMAYHRRECCW